MKEVMIILRPKMYFPTKDALDQAGFHSMTIREIIGRGKCPVHYDYDEGAPVKHRLVAKRMIDMFVRDEDLQKLSEDIKNAYTELTTIDEWHILYTENYSWN